MKSDGTAHARLAQWYLVLVGLILMLTGLAKVVSAFGSAPMLRTEEPVLGITYRAFFSVVGLFEIVLAVLFIRNRQSTWAVPLSVAFFFTALAYRGSFPIVGFRGPCSCLGNASEWLGISATTASRISLTVALLCFFSGVLIEVLHHPSVLSLRTRD
jgi:hypothetical protein